MKTVIKKVIATALTSIMVFTFAACNTEETKSFATVFAKDCFDSAGYIEFIAGAEEASDITFTAENSENAEWRVFVLDEAFKDGFRYISQAFERALIGGGTVSVEEGQFVYIYCSVNGFTADFPDENARLKISFS